MSITLPSNLCNNHEYFIHCQFIFTINNAWTFNNVMANQFTDHITEVLIDLHWLRIEERIVYKLLILTFKAFIDRTAPLYLCELIEQQKSSTNTRTRLANDAFLLKLPPPSRNCSDTFFERSFTYGAPYEWNKLDERVRRLSNFNMFKSEIKTVLFLRYFNS